MDAAPEILELIAEVRAYRAETAELIGLARQLLAKRPAGRQQKGRRMFGFTEQQQQALTLAPKHGWNFTSAAQAMGCSRQTFARHYAAGKAKAAHAGIENVDGRPIAASARPSRVRQLPADSRGQSTI